MAIIYNNGWSAIGLLMYYEDQMMNCVVVGVLRNEREEKKHWVFSFTILATKTIIVIVRVKSLPNKSNT
jgi:EamA domain-containing membrane protein RarD